MSLSAPESNLKFLKGGGEMGYLTRTYDWARTPLGPSDAWPLSLRTTLGILLHSAFPQFLFWGDELTCFYNDAYRVSLGSNRKHPAILGKPGKDAWPEIWDFVGPLFEQVMATGSPVWFDDQLVPVHRNGRMEDVYWTFSYSPAYDDEGQIAGIIVTSTETTQKVATLSKLQVSEQRFQNLIREASVGIVVLGGTDLRIDIVNDAYARLLHRRCDDLLGKPIFSVIPEAETVFRPIIENVRQTGESTYLYGQPYRLYGPDGDEISGLLDVVYQPYREQDGTITGVIVLCQDVTEQKRAEAAVRASANLFRNVTNRAPTGLWLSDETGGLTYLNSTLVEWTGLPYESLLGTGWASAIIDEDRQRSADAFGTAVAARAHYDVMFRIRRGDGRVSWCQAAGDPFDDEEGRYAGYAGFCMDVDELVRQRQTIEASEARFRSLIEEAPFAIGLFMGRELVIELPNQTFIEVVGKGPDIAGKPLAEVMPELHEQAFLQLLDDVYTSGKGFQTSGTPVQIRQHGVMTTRYYNITFTPLFNDAGAVYAILDISADVTEQVLALQKLEEAEAALRGAIELAELGTWEIDLTTRILQYSDRLRNWFGIGTDEIITVERGYHPIHEDDRPFVRAAIIHAITPGTDGVYDVEYRVDPVRDGRERILRAQGKAFYTDKGEPYRISGTVQDVTEQRRVQQELERQVAERTRQLQASVQDLERSNSNLQQFAYVASHDLQEPLRKIRQFGDLLKTQYANSTDEGFVYLERMQSAAGRMSTLIRDLLDYSRISTQRDLTASVPLGEVVERAVTTLELIITETGATVRVDDLPTVSGDASQLNQLFQNLLSNALKFRQQDLAPVIKISCRTIERLHLPPSVKPARDAATYYRIDVADNGVGFDEKYLDRIFQVFQRLHGKNEFSGTGIGLAICDKVAANHGGAITATSRPGAGAVFSVYLPLSVSVTD